MSFRKRLISPLRLAVCSARRREAIEHVGRGGAGGLGSLVDAADAAMKRLHVLRRDIGALGDLRGGRTLAPPTAAEIAPVAPFTSRMVPPIARTASTAARTSDCTVSTCEEI